MMGFGCNFRCRHCIQDGCEAAVIKADLSDKVIDYIKYLIESRPEKMSKLRLMFWGGEPLLYWRIIEKIISIFGDKLYYSMVTNGSLLTQEKVNYINKHEINVALSYDGDNTDKVRNINILDNPVILDLFKQIEYKSICAVSSAYNYDYQKLFDKVDSLLGEDVPVYIETITITWDMPKDLYNIPLLDYQNKLHKLAQQACKDILDLKITRASNFFLKYLQKLCSTNKRRLECGQIYNTMNIDLQGNVYSCHNNCNKIGTVKDERFNLIANQDKWVNEKFSKACESCPYFIICNGGCPNELTYENTEKISCHINKVLYSEVCWLANELENSFEKVDLG